MRNGAKPAGRMGASQSMPPGTHASNRSRARMSRTGAPAAHACGEEVG